MVRLTVVIAGLAVMLLSEPLQAQDSMAETDADGPLGDRKAHYDDCIDNALADAAATFDEAVQWEALGGGEPARHCQAVALFHMGRFPAAAVRFEALAQESRRAERLRAQLFAQGAQAWWRAGAPEKGIPLLAAAEALDPGNAELLVDRAILLAETGRYAQAVEDLNDAVDLDPVHLDARLFRAVANRKQGDFEAAEEDLVAVLALDPDQPDALLERGLLRREQGLDDAARGDWIRLLEVAPESIAADLARRNLERMDVDTGAP